MPEPDKADNSTLQVIDTLRNPGCLRLISERAIETVSCLRDWLVWQENETFGLKCIVCPCFTKDKDVSNQGHERRRGPESVKTSSLSLRTRMKSETQAWPLFFNGLLAVIIVLCPTTKRFAPILLYPKTVWMLDRCRNHK